MSTITQVIPPYSGTPPNRTTQTPSEFSDNADVFSAYFATTPTAYNTFAAQANALRADINATAATAQAAAQEAVNSANYKGLWAGKTGAANIPAAYGHNGKVWLLNANLANIAASEPSYSNPDWQVADDSFATRDTVAAITAAVTDSWVGMNVEWLGYYTKQDGGGNRGLVKSGSHTNDGFHIFSVNASLYIEADIESGISLKKAGVIGGVGDVTSRIRAAIAAANNLSSAAKLIGLKLPEGTLPISGGDATTPCLDLTNFKGAYFVGQGKGRTVLQYTGAADKVLALNKGVNGSDGAIENIEVGGFYIDCSGSTANYGVYADGFRRGRIFDIEVREANISLSYGYGWITRIKDVTSTGHKVKGFEFARASINGVTGENLSATTTVNTAVNFDILANSLTLIQPISEGTPAKGIVIKLGCRKINIQGGHTEGENTGIWNEATDQNGSNLTVDGMFFFSCDNPLVMSQRIRSLTFVNNHCRGVGNLPQNVVWQLNAQQFKFDGNNIEGANIAQEIAAVSVLNTNTMDKASVAMDGFKAEFNADEITINDRDIVYASAGPHDIQTYRAIPAGCAGEISIICRVSGTNTSVHTVAYRVSEDGVASFSNISQLGTAIITAVGYNAGTSRVTVSIAVAAQGIPCVLSFNAVVD